MDELLTSPPVSLRVIDESGPMMKFKKLIWIAEHPQEADKSAVGAVNRPLRVGAPIHDIPGISLKFIIGGGGDKSRPTFHPEAALA
jgi:hypothetical protein